MLVFINLLPFFAGIVACALGLVVLLSSSGRSRRDRIPFFTFAFSMGLWAILVSGFLFSTDPQWAYWLAVSYYVAALLLAYGFVLFCVRQRYGSSRSSPATRIAAWLTLPVALLTAVIFVPHSMVQVVDVGVSNVARLDTSWYGLYCVVFVIYSMIALAMLLRAMQLEMTTSRRSQHVLMVRVMYVCLPAGAFFNLLLPLFGNYDLIMIGPLFVFPVVVVAFYAMMRHSFFNVRMAVVQTVTYTLSLLTLALVYYVLAFTLSKTMLRDMADISLVSVGAALVLAFLFQPTKLFFDRFTDKLFYRGTYDSNEFFGQLSKVLTTTTDLRTLLGVAAEYIAGTFKSEQVFFFARYHESSYITAGTKGYNKVSLDLVRLLDERSQDESIILRDGQSEGVLRSALLSLGVAIVVPLRQSGRLIGYLFLGDQRNGSYTSRDVRVLESVPSELAIAIQNAMSLQEVRQLNATLQQRIDDATKELRESNEKLQRLDTAKDEFVSMASHQLRTPLTSVKGYISMVLEGDAGKISDMQTKLLGEAFTSSERMVHLINDFLNVSRLQTGKFMVDRREVDLAKVIAQEVDSLQTTARAHNLKLQYRQPSRFPVLYLDEGKLRQVIMNFIDNAIYYSRERSTITVALATEGGDCIVTVQDTGMGVPKEEQKHLFTKFFRATNARKQRPDGTGVGLFLAKKVVVAHGGSIVFDSIEGQGSTFGFRLPIKKLSLAPADDADQLDN